jgi:FkbM family methyltransferase
MNSFMRDYLAEARAAGPNDWLDNWDEQRNGPFPRDSQTLAGALRKYLRTKTLVTMYRAWRFVRPYRAQLEWLYNNVADDESRNWIVKLTAFRALGHRKVKLPTNTPEFWQAKDVAQKIPHGSEEIDAEFLGRKLHERSLELFGYPIRMFCGTGACYTTFVHEQYRCATAEGPIDCAPGDMAVDAGGCYGDTALYFAHKAGPGGRVASFEFLPVNVSVFGRNMELNPELAARIRLYENPVYSTSGQELFVVGNGPGTQVVPQIADPKARKVRTLKIDDLVASGDFPRIDFIKMDIEGAELEALKGSESVLRQFKPKLAITVYHDFKDFWTIPQYLDSLGLGYRFYLRHFTIHAEETVLFARAS